MGVIDDSAGICNYSDSCKFKIVSWVRAPWENFFIRGGLSFIWGVAAFATHVFIKSQAIDIRVRNTFNRHIVKALFANNILEGEMSKWRFSDYENKDGSYKVDDNKHPINLWHTPRPFNEGDDTRATRWNSWLMKFFFWLNISASLTFIAALLCPLVTTPHV